MYEGPEIQWIHVLLDPQEEKDYHDSGEAISKVVSISCLMTANMW
jgi:hypothetical protein